MKLRNATTGQVVASGGVWRQHCSRIHTLGRRRPIDVVFLDEEQHVMRTVRGVPPNRFAVSCAGAASVVELEDGALDCCDVLAGDRLSIID